MKTVFKNNSQTINSSVGPTILCIAKQKIIFKYSYQTAPKSFEFPSLKIKINKSFFKTLLFFKRTLKEKGFC